MRELQLNVRLSSEELARLDFAADFYGLSRAGLIRMMMKKHYRELVARGELRPRTAPPPPAVKRTAK